MISILVPTRRRISNFVRLFNSIEETARGKFEVLAYVDDDDRETAEALDHIFQGAPFQCHVGPRIVMSDMWNVLAREAKGDIFMLAGDDCVFRTPGWDEMVEECFEKCPDKILLVFGDDGSANGKTFATHPLVHRKWVETVGYFSAPGFSADYADTWPQDLADMVGRKKYLPFETEHLHPVWGKAEYDAVYRETNARLHRDNTPKLYEDRLLERLADADKLRAVMFP